MKFFTTSILALVFFYILLLSAVFLFQRNLLYHPSVDNYLKNDLGTEPTEIEKVNITTTDKLHLVGWFYNKDKDKFISPWCKVGQLVVIGRYAGARFKTKFGEHRIIYDDEIIGTIEKPEDILALF